MQLKNIIVVAGKGLVTSVYKVFMLIRIIFPAINDERQRPIACFLIS